MSKLVRVLVPVADGTEDMEFAAITDVFVRCNIEVITACCCNGEVCRPNNECILARGMKIIPNSGKITDALAKYSAKDFDAVVFPGGMPGAAHLSANEPLINLTKEMISLGGKIVGAICAAPAVVLSANGLLENVPAVTCFPFMKDKIAPTSVWKEDRVVVSSNEEKKTKFITSQGPGTALIFALQVAAHLVEDPKIVENVAAGMLVGDYKKLE